MDLAMQLIFTPMIWRLMERRRQRSSLDGTRIGALPVTSVDLPG
jgi:hypothetical protein